MFRSLAAIKRHMKEKERAEEENNDNQQQDDQAGETNEHIPEAIPLVDVGMHMAQFQGSIGQENKQLLPPVQTIHIGDQSNLGNSQIKRGRPRKLQGPNIKSEARDGDNSDHHQQPATDHPGRQEAAREDHHQQPAVDPSHQKAARELPKLNQWILAHDTNFQQQQVPPNNNGKPISPKKENENGEKLKSSKMVLIKDKKLASSSNSESDIEKPPKKLTFFTDPATILHQPLPYEGRSVPDVLHRLIKQPLGMQVALTKESTLLTDAAADANDHPQPQFRVLLPEALEGCKKSPDMTKEAPVAKKIKRASDYKFDFRNPPKKVRWEAAFIQETDQINWEPFVGVRPVPEAIKDLWAETFESMTKPKDKTPKL
ncbi:hypothetical protein COLO4_14795 [Corchorus olitorius]|uniref:Uncharacterized protein n=1 Tax=Corchorus olitorius TaxID=93759 RepID=A0A1R3JQY5_9ROSI|nr:hypothetical protein COLO4_14795 [Corchorus olitorius]